MGSTQRSVIGASDVAPSVSPARTANPSTAARSNGGTSASATMASARTRPAASPSGPHSVRSIGVTESSAMASASRSGMVSRIGRMRVLSLELADDVPELWQNQLLHRQADRLLGSRQREDGGLANRPRAGAAEHGGGADLLVAEHAEQLAEAIEPLVHQFGERFVGAVAGGDAGAAGGN